MKLITLAELLALPAGSIFTSVDSNGNIGSQLYIKGDNSLIVETDFTCAALVNWMDSDTDQLEAEELLMAGNDVDLDTDCYGRWASYNEGELFVLYSKCDVQALHSILGEALASYE